ncbi:hypothetical protein MLD38_037019 [Melastoma candidum]|uniref:Uncharacterized protein n=2 Tax=Melastoma candidum TaxID=119954 RepID=A0ACB9LL07_9MYRT|nr:hypothetical protein MLD38_037016 [Melastoma candidum]KAI4312178.1 hypothetical protein MLD38_037019 [Melastoma candidum]
MSLLGRTPLMGGTLLLEGCRDRTSPGDEEGSRFGELREVGSPLQGPGTPGKRGRPPWRIPEVRRESARPRRKWIAVAATDPMSVEKLRWGSRLGAEDAPRQGRLCRRPGAGEDAPEGISGQEVGCPCYIQEGEACHRLRPGDGPLCGC